MHLLKFLGIVLVALIIIWLLFSMGDTPSVDEINATNKVQLVPIVSSADFSKVEADTGCSSKYSEEKKRSLFREMYVNKQFTWTGKVVRSDKGNLWLNMGNALIGDLIVTLLDKSQGYGLSNGDIITVQFILDSSGGCFLPFKGEYGIVLNRDNM